MIGRLEIDKPPIDDSLSQMVESHRSKTGQDYGAILLFGLWGTADCSPEVRLYAAYQHLEANPEDGPAWLETARVHLEAGEADKAMAITDELSRLGEIGLYPGIYSEDPDANRALILAESGELDRALEALDALRLRHAESPVYHYIVATVLHQQGQYPEAVASYDESLETLEDFRREAEDEDMLEDLAVDFPAAVRFINRGRAEAAASRAFAGERPMDLSGFNLGEEG